MNRDFDYAERLQSDPPADRPQFILAYALCALSGAIAAVAVMLVAGWL